MPPGQLATSGRGPAPRREDPARALGSRPPAMERAVRVRFRVRARATGRDRGTGAGTGTGTGRGACDGAGGRYCAGSLNSSDAKALKCSLVSSDGCEDGGQGMKEGCGERIWRRLERGGSHRGCRKRRRWRVGRALDSDHEWLLSGFEALANKAAHGWEGAARTVAETSGALFLLCVVLGVLLRDCWRRFTASPGLFVAVLAVYGWR